MSKLSWRPYLSSSRLRPRGWAQHFVGPYSPGAPRRAELRSSAAHTTAHRSSEPRHGRRLRHPAVRARGTCHRPRTSQVARRFVDLRDESQSPARRALGGTQTASRFAAPRSATDVTVPHHPRPRVTLDPGQRTARATTSRARSWPRSAYRVPACLGLGHRKSISRSRSPCTGSQAG